MLIACIAPLCVYGIKRDYFSSRCNTLNKCLEEGNHKKPSQSALEEVLEENRYDWGLVLFGHQEVQ